MNRFYIYTTDKQDIKSQEKYFKDILSLISFEKIKKIDDDESKFMIRIFYAFGNTEIVKQLITRKETSNEMTIENAIENILQKQSFLESIQSTQYGTNKQLNSTDKFNDISEFDDIHFFDNELKFIANHFYELKNEQKVKLGFEFLKEIIKSNELRLETEDSLLEFINSIYIENPKASILYEFVYFNNVSDESIQKFSEIFDISHISNKIWKSIIERSIESKGKKTQDENKNKRYVSKSKIRQFLYKNGHEFDGIIKFLTDQTHGNIHDNGTIAVTYNKCCWDPKYLLDFNESNAYQATGTDCWICFDFKNRKIKMTGYSIKSYYQAPHLKSWKFEVSNDCKTWNKIDEHTKCATLNSGRAVGTFDVEQSDFSRYVRFYQTGTPWPNDKVLPIKIIHFLTYFVLNCFQKVN